MRTYNGFPGQVMAWQGDNLVFDVDELDVDAPLGNE